MSLCEDCSPECDHDYCDSCTKCHFCGVSASAPAAPQPPPKANISPNWTKSIPVMVPSSFNERDYIRHTTQTDQVQIH